MTKPALKKEKWTLSFDSKLKKAVVHEAKTRGIYPVQFLEDLVREKMNPYGYTDVKDSVKHVRDLRKKNVDKTEKAFIEEILQWER